MLGAPIGGPISATEHPLAVRMDSVEFTLDGDLFLSPIGYDVDFLLDLVVSTNEVPAEWILAVPGALIQSDTVVPVDWLASIELDGVAAVDWSMLLSSGTISPVGWGMVVGSSVEVLYESTLYASNLQSIAIEWLKQSEAALVSSDSVIPISWLSSLSNVRQQRIDWLGHAVGDNALLYEYGVLLQGSQQVPLGHTGSVGSSSISPIETTKRAVQDHGIAYGWSSAVYADQESPILWGGNINNEGHDSIPLDWKLTPVFVQGNTQGWYRTTRGIEWRTTIQGIEFYRDEKGISFYPSIQTYIFYRD